MNFKKSIYSISFLNLLFSSSLVIAQSPAAAGAQILRSTAEPARTGEAVAPIPETEKIPQLYPGGILRIPTEQKFSPEVAKIKFKLISLKIVDNVVFSCEELIAPFRHCLCSTITLGDLQEIAREMTTKYQQAGYVLTQVIIPQQDILDGTVTLQVVSGYIDKVNVTGCFTEQQRALLLEYGRRVQSCKPMYQPLLERYTLLANDTPGMKVDAVLKRSATPNAADLTFVVANKEEPSFIAVNNWGTRFLGPRQYVMGTGVDSLFQAGDATNVQIVTTANEELNFAQLRHTFLVGDDGLRLGGLARIVRTEPGSILEQFDSKGKNKTGSVDFFYPIIRSRREDLFVQGGFSVIDSKSDILGFPLYADRIRPLYVSLAHNKQDTFFCNLNGLNHTDITLTQGLKMLSASGATNISRPGGKSQFTKINATASRQQMLPHQFSLFGLITGQFSFQHLLAVSQFGFGGPELGRGYDPSELLGDKGLAGTLELRYDHTNLLFDLIERAQFYAFYDAGIVWHTDPTIREDSASSTGLGIRVEMFQWLRGNFFAAKPISRKVLALNNKHPRVFFAVTILLN